MSGFLRRAGWTALLSACLAPAAVADGDGLSLSFIGENGRIAPERAFGAISAGIYDPATDEVGNYTLLPFAKLSGEVRRVGGEIAYTRNDAFHFLGGPARLKLHLGYLSESDDESVTPDFPSVPNAFNRTCFALTPPDITCALGGESERDAGLRRSLDGDIWSGGADAERAFRAGATSLTASVGLAVEYTSRHEALAAYEAFLDISDFPLSYIDADADLTAFFAGLRFRVAAETPLSETLALTGALTLDAGWLSADLDASLRHTRALNPSYPYPAIDDAVAESVSRSAGAARLALEAGFAWRASETLTLSFSGTAAWRRNEPYMRYGTVALDPDGDYATHGASIGLFDAWSYGLRASAMVSF
ncbi:MAG: hypothetical protein QM698_13405 [Micropepsaceae bacterium]